MAASSSGRRRLWLLLAGLLFAAGAFLTALGDRPAPPPPRVHLPRFMDGAARERLTRRQTLPVPAAATTPEPDEGERPRFRDPMIAALPGSVKQAAVIIEANAIRNSPVGELLAACLLSTDGGDFYQSLRRGGLDPLKDVDRVAYVDETIILSGFFGETNWREIFKDERTSERLDERTVLWTDRSGEPVAVWKDQMMIHGKTRAEVLGVIDRLEGRAATEKPVLSEAESYGEIYGAVTPAAIGDLLGSAPELAERFRALASSIRLHVDTSHDVGVTAEVTGADASGTKDLSMALGAALVVGRLQAKQTGNDNMAEVLELARVSPAGDDARFQLEMGLPLAFFQKHLAACAQRHQRPPDGGSAP